MRLLVLIGGLAVSALSGCATARLTGPAPFAPEDPGTTRTVVIEPLFELADWQTTTKTELAQVHGVGGMGMGSGVGTGLGPPQTVSISRQVTEKPFFARPSIMMEIHRRVLAAVQALRPSWKITSTSGAILLNNQVTLVRTIIQGNELISSDRTLKNLAFGFGLALLPLQILAAQPVEETQRVYGTLERYLTSAEQVKSRLVRYPTQPDYAVSLTAMEPLRRQFGLDVSYEEGLLADETPRTNVLLDGFVARLAVAIVAVVEEPENSP